MKDNKLLIAGAVGLGIMYMMSQKKNEATSQTPNGYTYQPQQGNYPQQQKPTTGERVINTVNTATAIAKAGSELLNIFKQPAYVPRTTTVVPVQPTFSIPPIPHSWV
jgi:hypothetical protein